MRNSLSYLARLLACLTAGIAISSAQTSPTPQALPYTQNFGTVGFGAPPPGIAVWNGLNGGTINSEVAAAGSIPSGDATLTSATAVQTTGGAYGFAASGNGRLYIQASSNATNGVDQIVLAVNTSGWTTVTLGYDVEIISAQPRTIGVLCQYRVGTSGNWTTLTPTNGQNPYSQASGTAGVKTSPQIVLPAAAENQAVIQVRWATWRGSESGNSSGAAIDNISVSGTVAGAVLSASLMPSAVSEAAGANATILTVTRTGDTSSPLTVSLSINDLSEAAYDGINPLSIPSGQSSVVFPIRAVDDLEFDGSQIVSLTASAPGTTTAIASLTVVDNEDAYSPPAGYYDSANGLIGTPLKGTLKTVASPANYQAFSYANTYTPLRSIYEDPNNTANVITVYSGTSIAKNAAYFPGGPSGDVSWSREHIWPDSFGLDPDNVNPGSTGGDAGPDFTDLFNLRPCLQTVNSQRSNRYYDYTSNPPTIPPLAPGCSYDSDSWQPREAEKGDLARTIFYMATRYDGTDANTIDLEIGSTPSTSLGRFANLATLLRWSVEDPVSLEERQRNQNIFANWQHNRNPFIDHPDYAALIWGDVHQSKLAATVTEGGAGDNFTIVLGSQPTANVTINLSSAIAGKIIVSPPSIVFTSENWDQPQLIMITAVDDSTYQAAASVSVLHSISSGDSRYAALVPLSVIVSVVDNDPIIPPTTLPLNYGGPWDSLPVGFQENGLGSPYAGSLGGDVSVGSAKFDNAGDQLIVSFNAAPVMLSYQLKGNPSGGSATSGSFLVQYSTDGVNFAALRTIVDKDNSDQAFTELLPATARYIAFVYSVKNSGNIQLDKLAITAASAFVNWASTFGLSGPDAEPLADYDHDGLPNLADYSLGGSPISSDRGQSSQLIERVPGKLRLIAVIRKNDPALSVAGQTNTDLGETMNWTSSGVSRSVSPNQSGVGAGFERTVFEVDLQSESKRFLRLNLSLN